MAKKRTLVLINPRDPEEPSAGNAPLGTEKELCEKLSHYNTAADGTDIKRHGTMVLHGPGYTIEYAVGHDELNQAMVIVNNMDFAYPVLSKMCKALGWKMQDTESGQIFG
ncbi:MAG: hypothetical protein ACX94C_12935 [Phycisphaerales bacterium]